MPIASTRRHRPLGDAPFTEDQPLAAMIIRMLSTNALSAFAREIAPTGPALPVRGTPPVPGQAASTAPATDRGGRPLDAVPPPPARPLPRGSLLDLKV